MTPAQRRKRIAHSKRNGKRKPVLRLILIALGVLFVLYLLFFTKYWSSNAKLSLAIVAPDGSVVVTVLDPKNGEITNIQIPKNTQVDASQQLGTWRLKSIWALGTNEKIGGKLLKDTIVKNFKFPVTVWADKRAYAYATGDGLGTIGAMLIPFDTNLKIGDRLRIGIFSLGINNFKRKDIDLAKTGYLKKTKLTDGEEGYVVSGKIPKDLLVVFSDPEISKLGIKVNIRNLSGSPHVAEEVAETIEVMGAKVAALTKGEEDSTDCTVKGSGYFAKEVALLFSCKLEKQSPEGMFDLELEIGESFAARF